MDTLQQRVGTYLGEELQRVVYSICAWVLLEILREKKCQRGSRTEDNSRKGTYLIKGANGGNKDDGVRIIKIRYPRVALASCPANIKQVPGNDLSVDSHVKYMLCDPHGLYACVKYVIYRRDLRKYGAKRGKEANQSSECNRELRRG